MLNVFFLKYKFQVLISNGHGKLEELLNEFDFFQAAKNSSKLVCHFVDVTNRICLVVDKILEKLAAKHLGTRFVKVNAERVNILLKFILNLLYRMKLFIFNLIFTSSNLKIN